MATTIEATATRPRATRYEQDGASTGKSCGRVFFTASGFNRMRHQWIGLGSRTVAKRLEERLNAAETDAEAQRIWDAEWAKI